MYNIKRVLLHSLLLSSLALMPISVLASESTTSNSINKEPAKKSEMVTKKVVLNQNKSDQSGVTNPTVKKADWDDIGFGISIGRPYYYQPYYYYPYRPYYYHAYPYRYYYGR